MKKELFSLWLALSIGFSTLFPCAAEISFEEIDIDSITMDSPIKATENNFTEYDDIQNNYFSESPIEATENIYIDNKVSSINLLSDDNNTDLPDIIVPENLSYTTVDLTDLATGDIITHDCNLYLISNFNDDNHWNECTVCGKILNLETHDYEDTGWTGGSANNCNESNVHQFSCECGYFYKDTIGRKAHSYSSWQSYVDAFAYQRMCSGCQRRETKHECVKSNGSRISCGNTGKCSLCGYNYTAFHIGKVYDENGTLTQFDAGNAYCVTCHKWLGNVVANSIAYNSNGTITFYSKASLPSGATSISYILANNSGMLTTTSNSQKNLTSTTIFKYALYSERKSNVVHYYDYYLSGVHCRIDVFAQIVADRIAPVITDVNTNEENTDEWSTNFNISISGTENYCNSVYITLKDTENNVYLEYIVASVFNGIWNYEMKPNFETKDNKEFILVVSNALDNTTEQSFYVSKIDAVPPQLINEKEITTEWSKTKDYVVTTTDYGIGEVQNSTITTDNYELATESGDAFYKGYTFTGDVYGDTFVPVYSKDGLNNTSTEFVKVSNLDNTSPTIEDIDISKKLHNTSITIAANDINDKLNASGSGVTGYAITKENIQPTEFSTSNAFTIIEHGYYYIWVTDLVGNVTCKEIYIPVQYKMTIDPDGGIWQGSTEPKEFIIDSDEPINLYPVPEKEGYTFKEWKITGNGELDKDGNLTVNGDVEITPVWETNSYSVTYIDYDTTNNKELGKTVKDIDFGTEIRGFDIGSDTADNAYYNQYRLTTDTTDTVKTSSNTVYRYFEFCYTSKESHIDFNDNNNEDGLRPKTYILQLILDDGTIVREVELPSDMTDYTFELLPKYNEQGNEYIYKVNPVISDRYVITIPEDGEPEITYSKPAYNIIIPKLTTLNGKNGDLSYSIQIHSDLFYNDKITIIPDENVILTDGVTNLNTTVNQDKTIFTKEDVTDNKLNVTGDIQVNKKYFAGIWTGTFNFKIKYEVSN